MKSLAIVLDDNTYGFYAELADIVGRSVEDVLSDTLYETAEFIMRKLAKNE